MREGICTSVLANSAKINTISLTEGKVKFDNARATTAVYVRK